MKVEGCVYIFRQTGTNYYKIGMSMYADAQSRFDAIKMYSPLGAEISAIIRSVDPRKLESKIHAMYNDKRLSGEFFCLEKEDVDYIVTTFKSAEDEDIIRRVRLWLSDPNNSKFALLDFMKSRQFVTPKKQVVDMAVREVLNENFLNQYVQATDVMKLIPVGIDINLDDVGKSLSRHFKQISKRLNGLSKKVYFICNDVETEHKDGATTTENEGGIELDASVVG